MKRKSLLFASAAYISVDFELIKLKKNARNLFNINKLNNTENYFNWKKKILVTDLEIDVKRTFTESQLQVSERIDVLEFQKWNICSKTLFRVILISIKSSIKKNSLLKIDEKVKSEIKL